MKVFLGGTCGNSTWREDLIPVLEELGIEYFNPVIKGRKRVYSDRKTELDFRKSCDYVLYVITTDIRGVYSIAEVIDDSNKKPKKTLFLYLPESDSKKYPLEGMDYSLMEVGEMVQRNGGRWFKEWEELLEFFERRPKEIEEEELREALAYTE